MSNMGNKEMALIAYWVMDCVGRCKDDFTSQHLVKYVDMFDGALAQVTGVYSLVDDSKHRRQKVYKDLAFVKEVLTSEVENTITASGFALKEVTTSNRRQSMTMNET